MEEYSNAEQVVCKQELTRNCLQVVLEMSSLYATDGKTGSAFTALRCLCVPEIKLISCFDETLADEDREQTQVLLTRLERQLSKYILELIKTASVQCPATWAGKNWIPSIKKCYAAVLACASCTKSVPVRAAQMAKLISDMSDATWLAAAKC